LDSFSPKTTGKQFIKSFRSAPDLLVLSSVGLLRAVPDVLQYQSTAGRAEEALAPSCCYSVAVTFTSSLTTCPAKGSSIPGVLSALGGCCWIRWMWA